MSAVAFPADDEVRLGPPSQAEAELISAGLLSACAGPKGTPTPLQSLLIRALSEAMTGYPVPPGDVPVVTAGRLALGLARRSAMFRERVLQLAILAAMVEHPVEPTVAEHLGDYARALGVTDRLLGLVQEFANGSRGLALLDFNRSGYTDTLSPAALRAVHTTEALGATWAPALDDPALAARWRSLEGCPEGSLGLGIWRFYTARGFRFPGEPGSAPPYLAQHDWVHVLADYGSTVESELEVFGFIARATDDPRGFALLAMVIGLFETGDVERGAGLFEASPGHLSGHEGMVLRLADALRRGAMTTGDQALLERDWFRDADRSIEEVRAEIGVVPKSDRALAAGSVGPFDPGSLSPYQDNAGRQLAALHSRRYDAWGATVAR